MQNAVESRRLSQKDAEGFFARMPKALPIFCALEDRLLALYPDTEVRVLKTQVAFGNGRAFAYAWLPIHDVRGRPDTYLVLSLGLPCHIDSPRIEEASEPYHGRWMHHLIIDSPEAIDAQLIGWIGLAYRFALARKARKTPGASHQGRA